MRKIKLSKLQTRALQSMVDQNTNLSGEIDFKTLNEALNKPYEESNKQFFDALLKDVE